MVRVEGNTIYGKTGQSDIDGILSPEQESILNEIQESAAHACLDYLDQMQPGNLFPEVAMATGVGKGNIIHRVIEKQIRQKPDSKILIVAGTKTVLVKQTHRALAGYQSASEYIESEEDDELTEETTSLNENLLGKRASFLYRSGSIGQVDTNVHVATIQTLQSVLNKGLIKPSDYDLVIVDEVHNIGTQKRKAVIDQFEKVVGFTATSYRHSGRMKTPEQYGFSVIQSLSLPEAQNLRLLPPLVGMQIDTKDLVDEIPTTSTGQIDFSKLEKVLKKSPDLRPFIANRITEIISSNGRNYKTVIAVNFVWEAQELAELLYQKGIKVGIAVNQQAAQQIHTDEIPTKESIERYKLPEENEESIQVLISPYVASEGFDAPYTEVLVWASPTDSPMRYTQYTGRLARRALGKRFGIIVDCLYQTNKYRWSYNMGMWMKGDVRQLESGLLWLGPETDIDEISQLPLVVALSHQSDGLDISDVRNEELLDVQENDFPLTSKSIGHKFRLGYQKETVAKARMVAQELVRQGLGSMVKRKSGRFIIDVMTDNELFLVKMIQNGAQVRKSNYQPTETGMIVSRDELLKIFFAGSRRVKSIADEVLEEMRTEDSELVVESYRKGQAVTIVSDRLMFVERMHDKGVELRESMSIPPELGETELSIGPDSLVQLFRGNQAIILAAAEEVQKELSVTHPAVFCNRRIGNQIVPAVTEPTLFINLMLKKEMVLKETLPPPLQSFEFSLALRFLNTIFIGKDKKIKMIAKEVIAELRAENPDLFEKRSRHNQIIEIVTDEELFIQKMLARGLKLKGDGILGFQEDDSPLTKQDSNPELFTT